MHTVFKSANGDVIKINVDRFPLDKSLVHLAIYRNNFPESTFTPEELHRVLDNARDVLLVMEGHGSNYRGEFQGKGDRSLGIGHPEGGGQ